MVVTRHGGIPHQRVNVEPAVTSRRLPRRKRGICLSRAARRLQIFRVDGLVGVGRTGKPGRRLLAWGPGNAVSVCKLVRGARAAEDSERRYATIRMWGRDAVRSRAGVTKVKNGVQAEGLGPWGIK